MRNHPSLPHNRGVLAEGANLFEFVAYVEYGAAFGGETP
jgi:hypothetical protein